MSNIPTKVQINEEGPREGFQFEKGVIPTERKIELIDSLSETGLNRIQIVSFVNPKAVPGMADAEQRRQMFRRQMNMPVRNADRQTLFLRPGKGRARKQDAVPAACWRGAGQ